MSRPRKSPPLAPTSSEASPGASLPAHSWRRSGLYRGVVIPPLYAENKRQADRWDELDMQGALIKAMETCCGSASVNKGQAIDVIKHLTAAGYKIVPIVPLPKRKWRDDD